METPKKKMFLFNFVSLKFKHFEMRLGEVRSSKRMKKRKKRKEKQHVLLVVPVALN